MKKAAAIVSRELGVPAVVGTGRATEVLADGAEVTVSCAEGDTGFVYEGIADYDVKDVQIEEIPETATKVMFNLANPGAALRWWRLPADGVGLARMEFFIGNIIRIHPMASVRWPKLEDAKARDRIEELTRGWPGKPDYFVDTLAQGIARIAASQYPKPVIVRTSDFKTNEYARLIGGREFEPLSQNHEVRFIPEPLTEDNISAHRDVEIAGAISNGSTGGCHSIRLDRRVHRRCAGPKYQEGIYGPD